MMTSGITSKQQTQISRLVEVAAGNAALFALEQVPLDLNTAQEKIIEKGGGFQALLLSEMTATIARALNRLSGKKHSAALLLEKYFQDVYGYRLDLTGVTFPEKEGFTAYMAVSPDLDEDTIKKCLTRYFKVNPYARGPVADINNELGQKRPPDLYTFAHRGGDEPDDIHRNKSYDDATAEEGLVFLNPKEYLLANGFHRYVSGYFMDRKGWTRTSSLWPGGRLVYDRWDIAYALLYLDDGYRACRDSAGGPREAVLV
jgi:hypothetical protein